MAWYSVLFFQGLARVEAHFFKITDTKTMPAIECVFQICQPNQGNGKYDILIEKSFQDITITSFCNNQNL